MRVACPLAAGRERGEWQAILEFNETPKKLEREGGASYSLTFAVRAFKAQESGAVSIFVEKRGMYGIIEDAKGKGTPIGFRVS